METLRKIQTVEDVAEFARYLAMNLHLNFHPDDSFEGCLEDPAFAAQLDNAMTDCFAVCQRTGYDIYGVMGWPDELPYDRTDATTTTPQTTHRIADSVILN